MRAAIVVAIVPLAGMIACQDTSPKLANVPTLANVTGTWSYSTTNVSDSLWSCNLSLLTLTLTQSGNAFTGSASGEQSCGGRFDNVVILNGSVLGDSVSFDIQMPRTTGISILEINSSGTISGNSMSGDVTVLVSFCGIVCCCEERTLSGNWSAVRR